MLKFNGAWRFDTPGPIADGVSGEFSQLIGKVAAQGSRQDILEHFKDFFAGAAGSTSSWSSSTSWSESDLHSYMNDAAANAPLFIEAFYDACETLQRSHPDYAVPDVAMINRVLFNHNAGYQVQPPDLVSQNAQEAIEVPREPPSLDQQAQEIIQQSLKQSEQLLSEGRERQAVQEILWLLETVSTAFQGLDTGRGTVQGKYFNKIADDLRKHHKGKILDQVLSWVTTLHGYLSSDSFGSQEAEVYVAVALNHAESQVSRGENDGQRLAHTAVVRTLFKIGTVHLGQSFAQDVQLKLESGIDPHNLRLIAFLQQPHQGRVMGAAVQSVGTK